MPWKLYLRTFAAVIGLGIGIAVFGGTPFLVRAWEERRAQIEDSDILWIAMFTLVAIFEPNWEFERVCNGSQTHCIGVMRKWTMDLDSTDHVIVTWDGRNPNSWWWASDDYLYLLDTGGADVGVTWVEDNHVILDHLYHVGEVFGCLPSEYKVEFELARRGFVKLVSEEGPPERCADSH